MSFIGDLLSAAINSDASHSAANKQSDAARYGADMQWKMYDQTRQDNMPALGARNTSLAQLLQMLGVGGNTKAANYGSMVRPFTGADLANDPGYQFGLNQGRDAIQHSAAARGGLYSGATMKALERYGQDYGGTKLGEAFQRNRQSTGDMFDRFASLAGLGQTGASQIGQAGMNAANNAGNYGIQGANAQAAAQMYGANQLSNGFNSLAAWAGGRNWGSNGIDTSSFRWDDPYRSGNYFGGGEGE